MAVLVDDQTDSHKISDEIIELADDKVNKYLPGKQIFRFVGMTGLQELTTKQDIVRLNISTFLMNKDLTPFQNTEIEVKKAACIKLDLPKDVTRNFPYAKYIPVTTRFVASFENGDITKPKIIAGRFENTVLDKNK